MLSQALQTWVGRWVGGVARKRCHCRNCVLRWSVRRSYPFRWDSGSSEVDGVFGPRKSGFRGRGWRIRYGEGAELGEVGRCLAASEVRHKSLLFLLRL